jgi:outer membrane lipoprotein-sorting protein
MEVYDDEGLYEKYEFNNLVIDPQFEAEEFSSDFEDYGF